MASHGALNELEVQQFNQLLQRAQTHGVQVTPPATPEKAFSKSSGKFGSPTVRELLEQPSSSMTDASKRQRSDSDWEQVDYTPAVMPETSRPENLMSPSKQLPLIPSRRQVKGSAPTRNSILGRLGQCGQQIAQVCLSEVVLQGDAGLQES